MNTPLASALKLAGWSQSDLARAIGVTPAYVNAVVAGRKAPSPRLERDVALALSPALGPDADDLRRIFFEVDDPVDDPTPSFLEQKLTSIGEETR